MHLLLPGLCLSLPVVKIGQQQHSILTVPLVLALTSLINAVIPCVCMCTPALSARVPLPSSALLLTLPMTACASSFQRHPADCTPLPKEFPTTSLCFWLGLWERLFFCRCNSPLCTVFLFILGGIRSEGLCIRALVAGSCGGPSMLAVGWVGGALWGEQSSCLSGACFLSCLAPV